MARTTGDRKQVKTILRKLALRGARWLLVHGEEELMKEIRRHDMNKIAEQLTDKITHKIF